MNECTNGVLTSKTWTPTNHTTNSLVKITLLLEHKSYPVKHPHLRLNRYMLNVWEGQIRQKATLTPILPIIIYHGQSRWKKRPLWAYFPGMADELSSYLPTFDYVLIGLGTIEEKRPRLRSDYAKLTGLLLQHSRRKRALIQMLETHAQFMRNLAATDQGRAFVATTVIYPSWTNQLTTVAVITIFERISTQAGQAAMSAAQTWINQSIEQGIEQGIRGMLKLDIDAAAIAAVFELTQADVERLIEKIRKEAK